MTELRVSELAERAGVTASTVRFYERAGLLSPARRAANGYRVFDESALDELAFVSRAKGIGMSLEDIADLLAAWPAGECQSLQARWRAFLDSRIAQAYRQMAELSAFASQLHAVLDRLTTRDPGPERCGKGCSCETELDLTPDRADLGSRPWSCSLGSDALTSRISQWRALAATATSVEHTDAGVRLVLPSGPGTVAAVAALCAAETECCTQTSFRLDISTRELTLTAAAPDTPDLLDVLFSAPVPAARDDARPCPGRCQRSGPCLARADHASTWPEGSMACASPTWSLGVTDPASHRASVRGGAAGRTLVALRPWGLAVRRGRSGRLSASRSSGEFRVSGGDDRGAVGPRRGTPPSARDSRPAGAQLQGYLTARPERRRDAGSAAGRRQVGERSTSGPLNVVLSRGLACGR